MKASASEPGVQRPKTVGAGLGWREAQRRWLEMAIVLSGKKAAEPFPLQPSGRLRSHSFQYAKNLKIRGIGCEQTADAADVEDSR